MEIEVMKEIQAGVPEEADAVGAGVTRNAVSAAQSTNVGARSWADGWVERSRAGLETEVGLLSSRRLCWRRRCDGVV